MKDKDYLFPLSLGNWDNIVKPRVWSQAATLSIRAGLGLWTLRPHPWLFLLFPQHVRQWHSGNATLGRVSQSHWLSILRKSCKVIFERIWDTCFLALICTLLFPNQPGPETQSWQAAVPTYQGSPSPPSLLPVPPDVFLLKWRAYWGYSVFC